MTYPYLCVLLISRLLLSLDAYLCIAVICSEMRCARKFSLVCRRTIDARCGCRNLKRGARLFYCSAARLQACCGVRRGSRGHVGHCAKEELLPCCHELMRQWYFAITSASVNLSICQFVKSMRAVASVRTRGRPPLQFCNLQFAVWNLKFVSTSEKNIELLYRGLVMTFSPLG